MELLAHKRTLGLIFLFTIAAQLVTAQVSISLTATNGTCPGNGSITVNATGVSGTPLYSIKRSTAPTYSPEQTSNVFNNYGSGTYTVKVHDATGETVSSPVTLTNDPYTTISILNTTAGNVGITGCSADGSIDMNIAGGRPPFTYHLSGGPTAKPDVVTTSRNVKYNQLATGTYRIDITDACSNNIVKGGITITSLYNLSGVVFGSLDGMGGPTQHGGNCTDSLTFSTNNILLKDINGVVIFQRDVKQIPSTLPIEARVEYPANSGLFTAWQSVFGKFPLLNYQPGSNQYRVQLRNPCDQTNIVTSPAYAIPYPFQSRSGFCAPSITRTTNNYNCGPIDIQIVNKTTPTTTRNYTWDGTGLSYTLDLTGLPAGSYAVNITTGGITYASNDVSTTLSTGITLAATYDYVSTLGCNFATGGIRSYGTNFTTDNTIPITYTIVSGPATPEPVTSLLPLTPIWDNLPAGTYQVRIDYGDCRTEPRTVVIAPPYAGFSADELTYTAGSSCGKYLISGKGWYLAPDGSISPAVQQYAVKLFDAAGVAITGTGVSATANNNSPFTLGYEVSPGTYRVKLVNQLHSQLVCYYLEKTITIPPYEPVQINITQSGGVACGAGFGTVHVETLGGTIHIDPSGGSGRTLAYRIKPFGTPDASYTPYQASPDFPNQPVGVYTAQVFDSCNYTTTQNIELVARATSSSIRISGAAPGSQNDSTYGCQNSPLALSVNVIGTATGINWTLPNGTVVPTAVQTITNFTTADTGKYFVSYTAGGCSRTDSVTLLMNTQPTFALVDTTVLCLGDSVDLATTITGLSANTVDTIFLNPQLTVPLVNTMVTPVAGITYFVQATDTTTGCKTAAERTRITVNGPPLIGPVVPPPAICAGQSLALTVPTITAQGSPVTNQGWILNGNTFSPTRILLAADNGIEINYFAQSACGISVTPTITVTVNPKPAFAFTDPDPVYSPNTVDLHDLALGSGDTTGLTMNYYDSVYNLLSDAEIAAADSGDYHIIGTTASGCSDTSTVTVTVFQVPLPVGMLYFKVAGSSNTATLTWGTSFEQNSQRFDIEQSNNGHDFTKIAQVAAAGTSGSDLHYSYTDDNISRHGSRTLYYRLKQVDLDGRFKYSNIVRLKVDDNNTPGLKAYPIPFTTSLTLDISGVAASMQGPVKIDLVDMNGRNLYSRQLTIGRGQSNIVLTDLAQLAKGVYQLRLSNQRDTKTTRVVRQ
ncbi:T9SS type A sorting domain-containing protein [Paraflavitalea pollutisoli]|uniref:T9SS type A sorting domain-containing protein n=1 Tax=Paraflavitalea pollutisoli TaxID=3034143 RepID=UPI0023EC9B85|nr:T9SS type A sorting domain-containing protein [Paraflavitalea sp. H1-2-19X]